MNKSNLLRKKLKEHGIILSPGVYDCISAKIAERSGFEVIFTSGFGISGSVLGYPDLGLLTATEKLNTAGHISKSVDIPLIADIDIKKYQELEEKFSTRKPPALFLFH